MPPSEDMVLENIVILLISLAVFAALTFSRFARSDAWQATVTPLASIIGSGFLICGPLLAREFGTAAFAAMALLLGLAYATGAVIRFNIIHVENHARTLHFGDPFAWTMRATQAMLAIAYAVSVAYYLKLLAEFSMKLLIVPPQYHAVVSNLLVTAIIVAMTALTISGDFRKIEHAAHATVSAKIGLIGGLLVGLVLWWLHHRPDMSHLPPARVSWESIPMLLGLLITVQGFETSRYLGHAHAQPTRVRTMRLAQWISSAIYLAFLALLTPLLGLAVHADGVAGIYDVMRFVMPLLGLLVLAGAVASQLSAAIADTIGSGGLLIEVSRGYLKVRSAFAASAVLAIAVVWLTDPFEVIAVASRAFAAFYAMQALLAYWVSARTGAGGRRARAGFVIVGGLCVLAALTGAPAEG